MSDLTLKAIEGLLDNKLDEKLEPVHKRIDGLHTSIDNIAKNVKIIKEELPVLREGHKRVKHVLVDKHVATEDELSIQES